MWNLVDCKYRSNTKLYLDLLPSLQSHTEITSTHTPILILPPLSYHSCQHETCNLTILTLYLTMETVEFIKGQWETVEVILGYEVKPYLRLVLAAYAW